MFRREFPRMYELRDKIGSPDSLNIFWKNLDNVLQDATKMIVCRPYEDALQALDSTEWEFLKAEASVYLTKWDEENGRGQQQLIDILNQAKAYRFLLNKIGCSDIHFIPRSKINGIKTPDLEGCLGEIKVICEVKTINISDDEVIARSSIRSINRQRRLDKGFFDKLRHDLIKANKQIECYNAGKASRSIVYIIPNFDNFWGEYKEDYFKQIDQYLCENVIHGIEIVFHNQRTAFHMSIIMKYATVVNEEYCGVNQKDC